MPRRWTTLSAWLGILMLCTACGGGGGGGAGGGTTVSGLAPAAQIFLASISGLPGTFQFYGQGADPDCTALSYSWDLDGDGSEDSTLQAPTFAYATDGERLVTLTVTDAGNKTATATCTVSVSAAAPGAQSTSPGVQLRCHTLLAEQDLQTTLVAQADDRDPGSVTSYEWDLDGDGAFDDLTTPTRLAVGVGIMGPGQVTLGVRAVSDDGSSSTATCTIFLCDDGTLPDLNPGFQIESDTEANGPTSFDVGATAQYMVGGGDIDGGTISSVVWDTDDDLLFDDAMARLITTPAWPGPGETPIRVRARGTDEEGRTSDAQAVIVTRFTPSVNRYPEAQVIALTTLGSTGTPIQFIGTATDQDGDIATIEWDIDGDRDFDDGTTATPTFTFTEKGVYTPTMRVTDAFGNVSEAWMTLVVECCEAGGYGPYWWCDCDDKSLGHGANVLCPIDCPVGAGPTEAGVWYCNGQMGVGGDPNCDQVTLFDPGGGAPVGPLPAVTAPFSFGFRSDAVDGPTRAVGYTVALKLREPGVRVQILKCQINVVHDLTACFMPLMSNGSLHGGDLQFRPGPGLAEPILQQTPIQTEIVALRLAGPDQTPAWLPGSGGVTLMGGTPPGWQGQADPINDVIAFLLFDPPPGMGSPIFLDGRANAYPNQGFQLNFQDQGQPPQMGEVQFLDIDGNIVAREPVLHQQPPP